jgi:hypothetical protein
MKKTEYQGNKDIEYINTAKHKELYDLTIEIQKMLESMIRNPGKFCTKT